jgi:hypothetical protein
MNVIEAINKGYNLQAFATVLGSSTAGNDEVEDAYVRWHQLDERPYKAELVGVAGHSLRIYCITTNNPGMMEAREDELVRHTISLRQVVGLEKRFQYSALDRRPGELVGVRATLRFASPVAPYESGSVDFLVNERAYPGDPSEEMDRLDEFLRALESSFLAGGLS